MSVPLVAPFTDLEGFGVDALGGKGKGLVEMDVEGFPVPPGIVVTTEVFSRYLVETELRARLLELVDELEGSAESVNRVSEEIQELIARTPLPPGLDDAVRNGYRGLCESLRIPDVSVAVRSSATAEDSSAASFAGEFETWVDVRGEDSVVEHVIKCFQSMFVPRVLDYLLHQDMKVTQLRMAVVVQKTVRARSAGVMFTLDPLTGDPSVVVIEGNWGLGLPVVGGEVIPDRFVVNRVTGEISTTIGRKEISYTRGDRPPVILPEEQRARPCLQDSEVTRLAELGQRLHAAYGTAQDVEFALDDELEPGHDLLLLQCRPETYWSQRKSAEMFTATGSVMSWVSQAMTTPEQTSTPRGFHEH